MNDHGTVHGELLLPEGAGPHRVALIVPGSGPTDRNGNATPDLETDTYCQLARELAHEGIASLRYDKAGVGESLRAAPASEDRLRFEQGVTDAARWISLLRDDRRFEAIAVVGHSEGSLVGMLAAADQELDAVVSLAGAGRPAEQVLEQQLRAGLDGAQLERALDILRQLGQGRLVPDVPAPLGPLFRFSVQPYLISWMAHDPTQVIRHVNARVLIVQGTTDLQVPTSDGARLHEARDDATYVELNGMNHVLKMVSHDPEEQRDSYSNPALPIARQLVRVVADFLRP